MEDQEHKKGYFRRSKLKFLEATKNVYGKAILNGIEDSSVPNAKEIKKARELNCVRASITKVMIKSKLGPGRYLSHSPSINAGIRPSSSFSALPRFLNTPEEKFAIRPSKSPVHPINQHTPSVSTITKASSSHSLKQKKKLKQYEIKVAIEAKKIIQKETYKKRLKILSNKIDLPVLFQSKPNPSKSSLAWSKLLSFLTSLAIMTSLIKPKRKPLSSCSRISPKRTTSSLL